MWKRRVVTQAAVEFQVEPQPQVARPALDEWLAAADAEFEAERGNVVPFRAPARPWVGTGTRPESLTA